MDTIIYDHDPDGPVFHPDARYHHPIGLDTYHRTAPVPPKDRQTGSIPDDAHRDTHAHLFPVLPLMHPDDIPFSGMFESLTDGVVIGRPVIVHRDRFRIPVS